MVRSEIRKSKNFKTEKTKFGKKKGRHLRRERTTFLIGDSVQHLCETNGPLLRHQLWPVVGRGAKPKQNLC
jgi:hypothetical protein